MRIFPFFYFLPSLSTAFLIDSPLGPNQHSAKASIHIIRRATAVESDVDDELDVLFLSDDDDAIDENVNNRRRKLRWSKVATKSRQKVESNVPKRHESKQDKKRRTFVTPDCFAYFFNQYIY